MDVLTGRALYLKAVVPAGPRQQERADTALAKLVEQVEQGRQPRTNASVLQMVQAHLKVAEYDPRSLETYEGYVRKHVKPRIGTRPIGSLRAETLESFYAELRRCRDHCDGSAPVRHRATGMHQCDRRCHRHTCRPLAAATIRKIHFLLSAAYESAIRWDWVAVNPTSRAKKPAPPAPDPQPPTPEQAAALINEAWRRGFGPLVWVAMTTGARRGELCALRWNNVEIRHIDTDPQHDCAASGCAASLIIRRSIGQSDGRIWETDTKTHQRRHVALDAETLSVLLSHRQRCEEEAALLGDTFRDTWYIFAAGPDWTRPARPASVSQRYARAAAQLGFQTSLKCLRHYSATELITAGVDVRTVAGRLGHSGGGTTTLKVYAAWVSAADQHASTVLMNRMPQRPSVPVGPAAVQVAPRWPHEQLAASLHDAWQGGELAAGSVLTVKDLVATHGISTGTGHRVITLLRQWGVIEVRNGRPSTIQERPRQPDSPPPAPATTIDTAASAAEVSPPLLRLDLLHLGVRIRTLTAQADPTDFAAMQRLLRDAVRRAGNQGHISDYELAVHIDAQTEPALTVVVAA